MESFYIDKYDTENGVVLNDLGYDGMFIGFTEPISSVETEYIEMERER